MKTAFVVLCVLSVGSAVPLDFLSGLLQRQNSEVTGNAAGNVVTGTSGGTGSQNSQIVQVSAQAGGSASGNAVSTNSASASHGSSSGNLGSQQQSNTNAVSNQQTFNGGLFGGAGLQQPYQLQNQPQFQPQQLQPQQFQPQFQPQQFQRQQFQRQLYPNRQFF